MKNNFRPTVFFLILLTLLNTFAILVILWSCYHGIDISDESYYYMGYLYFDNVPDLSGASFHMIFNSFFSSFDMTLSEVRILRLLLTVLSACILFFGLDKIFPHKNNPEKFLLLNVVISGMLLSFSWAPLALSYNSMSTVLISLVIGVWLLFISTGKGYLQSVYSVIIGSLFIVLFFIKITNILLLPLIVVATLYILYNKHLLKVEKSKFPLVSGVSFITGAFVTLALFSKGISLIPATVSNHIQETFGMMSGAARHSTAYLLERYTNNAEMVIGRLKYPLIFLFAAFATIKLLSIKYKKETKSLHPSIFKLIVGIMLLTIVFKNDYWMGGTGFNYIILIAYLFIGIAAILNQFLEKKKVNFILLLGLISIPVIGAIGTNNGLSAQVLFYGAFIFLVIYYIVYFSENIWYKSAVLSIIVILCTSQVISGVVYRPYRQAILTQSVNKLEGLSTLKHLEVNNETMQIRKELAFLENVEANYIFSYSFMRGMALLANKKPYSLSWFDEKFVNKMCLIISKSQIEPKDIIFIIPSELPLNKEVIKCLMNNGVLFNKDYFLAKKFQYYDYKMKRELTLNVYLPSLEIEKTGRISE